MSAQQAVDPKAAYEGLSLEDAQSVTKFLNKTFPDGAEKYCRI